MSSTEEASVLEAFSVLKDNVWKLKNNNYSKSRPDLMIQYAPKKKVT